MIVTPAVEVMKDAFPCIRREFQTPYLLCDCNLLWLLRWIKERSITVKNTKCSFPQSLQGQLITSIKPELFTCGRDTHLEKFAVHLSIDLTPQSNVALK